MGLGRRYCDPRTSARSGDLEWLSAARIRYRRLSGAMVRRLSRAEPFDRLRHLPSFGPRLVLLDQSGISGAADAVDPAIDPSRTRHGATVAASRHRRRSGPDHGAALARQHVVNRHFRGTGSPLAFHSRRAQRQALDHREDHAVSVHIIRGRNPQRHVRRSVRPLLSRLDDEAVAAAQTPVDRPDSGQRHACGGCDDAARRQFRVIGQSRLDPRRCRRFVRANDAGRHRCTLPQRPLRHDQAEALSVSQSVACDRG